MDTPHAAEASTPTLLRRSEDPAQPANAPIDQAMIRAQSAARDLGSLLDVARERLSPILTESVQPMGADVAGGYAGSSSLTLLIHDHASVLETQADVLRGLLSRLEV